MTTFTIGDKVEWESGANGTISKKQGVVAHVIKSYQYVHGVNYLHRVMYDPGRRDHESYLVSVPSGGKGKPKLYWPRVSQLRRVNE